MAQLANGNEVVTPTEADAALAKELGENSRLPRMRTSSRTQDRHLNRGTRCCPLRYYGPVMRSDRDGPRECRDADPLPGGTDNSSKLPTC